MVICFIICLNSVYRVKEMMKKQRWKGCSVWGIGVGTPVFMLCGDTEDIEVVEHKKNKRVWQKNVMLHQL